MLTMVAAIAACSGERHQALGKANIINGQPSAPEKPIAARYRREAKACSAHSVQLLTSEAVEALTQGWEERDQNCVGPEKLDLPQYGDYPTASIRNMRSGSAHVLVRLEADGRIESVSAVCATDQSFGGAAVETVRKIRFSPMTCNGTPARIAFYLPLDYDI